MNKKLYKKLLNFRSHSRSAVQDSFRDWLSDYIYENYENVEVEIDDYGNIYVTKSTTPQATVNCVVAHLDINQSVKTTSFTIVEAGSFIVGINNENGKQIGLGHDDKTGVYFALKALKTFPNIKCFFPLDEEIGLVGTRNSVDDFFDNVGFLVQLDRRGYNEISKYTNGHATVTMGTQMEFNKILAKHNFHWANTVSTDVGWLIQEHNIQGTNISCGYMNEHKDDETLDVLRYDACEKFALDLLRHTNGNDYYMPVEKKVSTTNNSNYKGNTSNSTTTTSSSTATTTPVSSTPASTVEKVDSSKIDISKVKTESTQSEKKNPITV